MVDYSKLSETDLKIHQRHVAANKVHIFSQIFAYSNLEKKNEILCEDLFSNFSQLIHEQKSLKNENRTTVCLWTMNSDEAKYWM